MVLLQVAATLKCAGGDVTVIIPNPHEGEISVDLLRRILLQAGITREEWLQK